MHKLTWQTALAVPTALLLATGGALLAAGPASAATAFAVNTPADHGAIAVQQGDGGIIHFDGVGLPTGDTLAVSYLDGSGASHTATGSGLTNTSAGWAIVEDMSALTPKQTTTTAVVSALKAGVQDPAVAPKSVAFTLNPVFTVTAPAAGAPVTTAHPVITGLASQFVRVEATYVDPQGAVVLAGESTLSKDSYDFSIPTDFSLLAPGATSVVVTLTQHIDYDDSVVEGTTPHQITIDFATPPVAVPAPGITTDPVYPTLAQAATTGIGVQASGFAANEAVDVAVTGPNGAPVTFSEKETTPAANAAGVFLDTLGISSSAGGGSYTITVTGATSHTTETKTLSLVADATVTSPANHATVGTSFTITGRGTPGASVLLIIGPTKTFSSEPISPDAATRARLAKPAAAAPAGYTGPVPTFSGPIIVGSDGTWHAAFTSQPGDYSFQVYEGLVVNGLVQNLSDPSAPVEITVAAATAASVTGGTGTGTGTGTDGQLAFTGSQDTTPAAIAAGILMLIGTALTVVARRRRRALER